MLRARQIWFRVENQLPPKKDGAKSMWDKPIEAKRLIVLRRNALEALGSQPPFTKGIRLTLRVGVRSGNNQNPGDLDNFITGVCDGLMAAHRLAKIDPIFCKSENLTVYPSRTIAILDDSQVMKIDAEKRVGPGDWYEIEVEGE